MELRKDPITRSWVITGDDVPDHAPRAEAFCRFCPDSPVAAQLVSNMPALDGGPWSAMAVVHPAPLYRIEGEPARRGEGLYDRMSSVGAHEVLVENVRLASGLEWDPDEELEVTLKPVEEVYSMAYAGRITHAMVLDALLLFTPHWQALRQRAI